MLPVTKDQFANAYIGRAIAQQPPNVTVRELITMTRTPLPCYCGGEGCEGWKMVHNALIDKHMATDGRRLR
jgi:hypothetical protein